MRVVVAVLAVVIANIVAAGTPIVLVVDDEVVVGRLMQEILVGRFGCRVDVVTGGSGPDQFLLSQVRSGSLRVFYDDANSRSTGTADYLQIQDFNPNEDILRV